MAQSMTISVFKDTRKGGYIAELFYTDDRTGDRRSVRKHGVTKKAATEKIDEVRRQIDESGFLPDKTKLTVGNWLTRWIEDYQKRNVRRSTYKQQKMFIDSYIVPVLGETLLSRLQGPAIQRFLNNMLENGRIYAKKRIAILEESEPKKRRQKFGAEEKKPMPESGTKIDASLSPHTVRHCYIILNMACKQARRDGLIRVNPVEATVPPKLKARQITPPTEANINLFLDTAVKHRLYAAFVLSLATGMRRGELLALRWGNINLEEGSIAIKESISRLNGDPIRFDEPKTAASRRVVSIPVDVAKELKSHKARQAVEKLAARAKAQKHAEEFGTQVDHAAYYEENDLVFCTEEGRPTDPRNFGHLTKRLITAAGVPYFRVHDMRHFFATELGKKGENIKAVQGMMGHSTVAMTLNIYSHISQDMLKVAAQKMEGVLTKRKKVAGETD